MAIPQFRGQKLGQLRAIQITESRRWLLCTGLHTPCRIGQLHYRLRNSILEMKNMSSPTLAIWSGRAVVLQERDQQTSTNQDSLSKDHERLTHASVLTLGSKIYACIYIYIYVSFNPLISAHGINTPCFTDCVKERQKAAVCWLCCTFSPYRSICFITKCTEEADCHRFLSWRFKH